MYRKYFTKVKKLPKHVREQVKWRSIVAGKCTLNGSCLYCGCSTIDNELYLADDACSAEIPCYPEMMNSTEWQVFKIKNGIKL